ncbi:hypothetical protein HBI24_053080 [Parastagonospora nodorum]|nr:hypothetical protein HBI74_105750 [Parastagonospora nodorum]KAH5098746.1 hypothetical protein HBH72_113610 [Parastagonospora nodorum]KAH5478961.1 hypothetical protein HBI28_053630 [Parastagonospora nodorum]KAH5524666.1 hypothetical protein HBI52_052070 [Parastagonospora nodorum]KAH5588513.1 hypothetical protein HBI24_053080 [Parastagonospora nodorum]
MEDEWTVPDYLHDNFLHTLKEVKFRCLNVGGEGVLFDLITRERPITSYRRTLSQCSEDSNWVIIEHDTKRHEVELKYEDGDDLDFWLGRLAFDVNWGAVWTWDARDRVN